MAQTITLRRTVTGTSTAFTREFNVSAAAALSFDETVPETALVGDKLEMDLPIPNATAQVAALLLEATAPCKVEFLDGSDAVIGNEKELPGNGQAFIFPTSEGQSPTAGGVLTENTMIAKLRVWRDEAEPAGNAFLRGLVLYDPTP